MSRFPRTVIEGVGLPAAIPDANTRDSYAAPGIDTRQTMIRKIGMSAEELLFPAAPSDGIIERRWAGKAILFQAIRRSPQFPNYVWAGVDGVYEILFDDQEFGIQFDARSVGFNPTAQPIPIGQPQLFLNGFAFGRVRIRELTRTASSTILRAVYWQEPLGQSGTEAYGSVAGGAGGPPSVGVGSGANNAPVGNFS